MPMRSIGIINNRYHMLRMFQRKGRGVRNKVTDISRHPTYVADFSPICIGRVVRMSLSPSISRTSINIFLPVTIKNIIAENIREF